MPPVIKSDELCSQSSRGGHARRSRRLATNAAMLAPTGRTQ